MARFSSAEMQELTSALMPVFLRIARSAVAEAIASADRVQVLSGTVTSATAADVLFETDDAPGVTKGGTRTHPDIVAGSRVLIVKIPPAGVYVFGPIP